MKPKTLDHVAFWVDDRASAALLATTHLGMHVIEETERFTLVGSDARRGKLTLFDAEGPRQQGALRHVALRVSSLERARAALPAGAGESVELSRGLQVRLVEAETDVDYDLDHVALYTPNPESTAREYERFGFAPAGDRRVEVGGAFVELEEGDPGAPERPLLNHLAVLVDSAQEHIAGAGEAGIEVESVVDAPNTYAVFLWGPDRVRIEYVEHKPGFSLR